MHALPVALLSSGEGVSRELAPFACDLLERAANVFGLRIDLHEFAVGQNGINTIGHPLDATVLTRCQSFPCIIKTPTNAPEDGRYEHRYDLLRNSVDAALRSSLGATTLLRWIHGQPPFSERINFYVAADLGQVEDVQLISEGDTLVSVTKTNRDDLRKFAKRCVAWNRIRRTRHRCDIRIEVPTDRDHLSVPDRLLFDVFQEQFPVEGLQLVEKRWASTSARIYRSAKDIHFIATTPSRAEAVWTAGAAVAVPGSIGSFAMLSFGERHGVAQPIHGTAETVSEEELNPFGMALSIVLGLRSLLVTKHDLPTETVAAAQHVADLIQFAVRRQFNEGTALPPNCAEHCQASEGSDYASVKRQLLFLIRDCAYSPSDSDLVPPSAF